MAKARCPPLLVTATADLVDRGVFATNAVEGRAQPNATVAAMARCPRRLAVATGSRGLGISETRRVQRRTVLTAHERGGGGN